MSRRNALIVAVVAAVVLAVFFFWPDTARAGPASAGRMGGGLSGHDIGGRAHGGGLRGSIHLGNGGVRGRVHLGAGEIRRHRSFGGRHGRHAGHAGSARHGFLLGDRFRLEQHRRIAGAHRGGALLGDAYRSEQRRRLRDDFLRPKHAGGLLGFRFRHGNSHDRGWHDGGWHDRDWHNGDWHDRDWPGRKRYRHKRHGKGDAHRHGRHRGQWLGPGPWLSDGGAEVIMREVVVPVPVPVPASRPVARAVDSAPQPALDPRGRATLVGEGGGVIGAWAEGDILPREVPHVALDPLAYDLPQPPPGEKYARVGNDVLRIDIASRRITEVVAR